jgi:hypothetical protein
MIPKIDNYDHKQCGADVKESADVPKLSMSLFDVAWIMGDAPYLHTFIICRAIPPTVPTRTSFSAKIHQGDLLATQYLFAADLEFTNH